MAPDLNSVPLSPRVDLEKSVNLEKNLPSPPPEQYHPPKKPNILYIMADQLSAPLLKIHSPTSPILTPNLDTLATKSILFESAYSPSPLCAPSRMSMVTGQLPTRIGSYDNACSIDPAIPTYAHYLRKEGYETVLAGKMHFTGEQLHGYEKRLTPDIYPADYGWSVDWERPGERLEWYHNASSVVQAGTCVRSNQLDYDEEVMYRSKQFLYDHVRKGPSTRPFCMTVSLTHPHDPYCIEQKYWDLYEGVDIPLPTVTIPQDEQDPHSTRLLKVCDLWDKTFTPSQIKRARRAYYGAVSYVDDCIGKLLETLTSCGLYDDTIIVFSGDHGDMLGERNLWYKMSYFEHSSRVPLLISYPPLFPPRRIPQNVSTLDILPTLVDLVGGELWEGLPMDGHSLLPHLRGEEGGEDTVFAEYCGEGTVAPMCMIRRGNWKFIACPADPPQLYNLATDPSELINLASLPAKHPSITQEINSILHAFITEAGKKWDMDAITKSVLLSQRNRRLVWQALKKGTFTSWDYNPVDDGREKYIRSHVPLDDLELRARFPAVDKEGREMHAGLGGSGAGGMGGVVVGQAGAAGE